MSNEGERGRSAWRGVSKTKDDGLKEECCWVNRGYKGMDRDREKSQKSREVGE